MRKYDCVRMKYGIIFHMQLSSVALERLPLP